MNMPGGTIRRGTLVVVEQMDQDGAVRREFVPDRRGVLEARIDELQRMIGDCDRRLGRLSAERGQRVHSDGESDEYGKSARWWHGVAIVPRRGAVLQANVSE